MNFTNIIDPSILIKLAPEFFQKVSPYILELLGNIYGIIVMVSIIMSIIFVYGYIYAYFGHKVVDEKIEKSLEFKTEPAYENVDTGNPEMIARWRSIMALVDSFNQNDWARAVMESDIMLEEILEKAGYQGVGVGEKLKRVDKGDMENIDAAWEAHKVRNAIAHEPNFALNQHEAKRVIELFRKVFSEYYVI